MRKLLISFLVGAVLIGVGCGVMFIEAGQFTYVDYRQQLINRDSKTDSEFVAHDFEKDGKAVIHFYNNELQGHPTEIKIIMDSSIKDGYNIEYSYKGETPIVRINNYPSYYEDSSEQKNKKKKETEYHLNFYQDEMTPYSFLSAMEYMFENKVFSNNIENFIVESVTIKTAQPNMITIQQ